MAIAVASGYASLPDSAPWSPTIFSKKVQIAFRRTSVCEAVTNTDYAGEISNYGDSVKIIKEPTVTIQAYERGAVTTNSNLSPGDTSLVINKANYFQFKVDDVETALSHVNWIDVAADRAGYQLRDAYDVAVFANMMAEVSDANLIDSQTFSAPAAVNTGIILKGTKTDQTGEASPLQVLNKAATILDNADVPQEGRWCVAYPAFYEVLQDEDSKLINNDYATGDILRNGRVAQGQVRGFTMYRTTALPLHDVDQTDTVALRKRILMGHKSAVATANRLTNTERLRDASYFADIVRGLHLFGSKVIRPEALVAAQLA